GHGLFSTDRRTTGLARRDGRCHDWFGRSLGLSNRRVLRSAGRCTLRSRSWGRARPPLQTLQQGSETDQGFLRLICGSALELFIERLDRFGNISLAIWIGIV